MYSVNLGGTATQSLVSIGTNISSQNASIQNASVNSLSAVEFKTAVFSPHTLNTSVLNISAINLDPNFVFPLLNVSTLNSIEESFVNMSVVNISANNITADNIQPLLTAGDNISILNNVITALNNNLPATGNFTTLNTSTINASNLSTGDLTFGSNFSLNNKFLTVNSTNVITQNSGDLITSGAVFEAFNRFGTNISDGRSLINTKLIAGGDVIKPIVAGTTNIIDVDVDPGTSKNIMKVFYTTKLGQDAMLGVVANFAYVVSGTGSDAITARLEYNDGSSGDQNIGQAEQRWRNGQGGGTRSGVLSPRIGTRKSNVPAQTQVYFQIIIDNTFSNDTFTFLNPDACTFQITESLDNDGSDLNLNTGILQANAGTFNFLTVQPGSGSGQATIGKTFLGNNAFGNMACLSVIGNTGATNYGFAQVAGGNTIMNAMPGSYNSFRSSNNEIASIGDIGLGIALGVGNTASFPLEVGGSALFSGVVFASEFDSNEADITNLSNTNLSGTNATFQEINVSGNLIVNGTTFTNATLVAGENIDISNNVISAFFGSGGQVNLNHIQVDGGVDIGGVLNVSQTSNFSNSLNVGDILYAGEAGNHEGSVVLYSNIVGDNYATKINSSTGEVNSSATGNLNSINFFIGNNKSLEIKNNGIEVTNLQADELQSADLTAFVFTCIDGKATFRFNTPQLNASNASIDVGDIGIINSSVVTCDVLDTDDLELITLDVSNGNVSVLGVDTATFSILNSSRIVIDGTSQAGVDAGLLVTNSTAYFRDINVSQNIQMRGANLFIGNPADPQATRLGFYSTDPTGNIGLNVGINSDNHAEISIPNPTFNGVEVFNINFSAFDVIQLDNVSTRINNDLVVGNVSVGTLNVSQQMNISQIDTTTITSDNTNTFSFNLSDQGAGQSAIATTFVRSTNTTVTSIAGDFIFDMNPNSTAKSMIIRANGTTETRGIQNVGTIETRNFSVDENVSVTGSLSATNAEVMNDLDVYNDLFVANRIDATTVDANEIIGNSGDFGPVTATSVATTTTNTSTLNSSNGNFSAMVVNATGSFQTVVANNVNVAGTLTVNNLQGYQEELTAGSNISIVNNVISAIVDEFPSNANFSTVTADTITGETLNTSFINTSFFSCIDEAGFSGTLNGNIISCNGLDADDALFGVVASFQYNISNNLDDTEASTFIRNGNLTEFIHTGGRLRFSCNELQTSGVANFSTLNASNLSTATMGFTSDFTFDTFSNTLSLATNAPQAIADIETNGLTTVSVNTSSLNVDGITTLDIVAVSVGLNSTTNNLFNINSSGTANISVINNSTINSKTGNFSGLSVFGTLGAQNVTIPGTLNVANIPNFQRTVVAGVNMSIVNNVVFTLPSVNFSTINSSVINGDNLSTASISFDSTDFNFANDELSLATSASQIETNTIDTIKSGLTFDSFSTLDGLFVVDSAIISFGQSLDGPTSTITTGNFSTINSSVINGDNLSTASISFDPTDFNFNNGELSLVGSATLPTNANFSSVTATTGNFSTINASNIVGYQETLIAGNNISIVGNTISSTGGGGTAETLGEQVFYAVSSVDVLIGNVTVFLSTFNTIPKTNTDLYTFTNNNTITILKSGFYKINFQCNFENFGFNERTTIRTSVMLNAVSDITSGGQATSYTRNNTVGPNGTTNGALFYELTAGDFIQLQNGINQQADIDFDTNFNSNYNFLQGSNIMITRMDINAVAADGTFLQGKLTAGTGISLDGDVISATGGSSSGISIVATGKIDSNGTNVKVIGCSVSRTNVGRYSLTFDTAQPDADYVVQLTVIEDTSTVDDIIITFDGGTALTTGFSYSIHEQDNGTNPGTYRDKPHFVTVTA